METNVQHKETEVEDNNDDVYLKETFLNLDIYKLKLI